jgi:hypothetical protein
MAHSIIRRMHVLIPFASAHDEVAAQVLHDLTLPSLTQLLQRLTATRRDEGVETSLSPPHERALAAFRAWPMRDGALPFAAFEAAADGVDVGALAWGLLTPAHWSAGRDRVTLLDPATLVITQAESRALFDAVRHLFESEGFTLAWGSPLRWYAAHPSLADMPCASLDRVIGRGIETWLPQTGQSKLLRRLQSEVQLLLYTHPINQAREDRGALAVNSFWISGCGVHVAPAGPSLNMLDALRTPLLASDWAAWAEAWRALDAGPLADLRRRSAAGEDVTLTLCGERHAQTFESRSTSVWSRVTSRWRSPSLASLLEAL